MLTPPASGNVYVAGHQPLIGLCSSSDSGSIQILSSARLLRLLADTARVFGGVMHIGSSGDTHLAKIGDTHLAKNSISIQLLDKAEAVELVDFDLGFIPRTPGTCLKLMMSFLEKDSTSHYRMLKVKQSWGISLSQTAMWCQHQSLMNKRRTKSREKGKTHTLVQKNLFTKVETSFLMLPVHSHIWADLLNKKSPRKTHSCYYNGFWSNLAAPLMQSSWKGEKWPGQEFEVSRNWRLWKACDKPVWTWFPYKNKFRYVSWGIFSC